MTTTTKKAAAARRKLQAAKIVSRGRWPGSRLREEAARAGFITVPACPTPFIGKKAAAAERGRLMAILMNAADLIETGWKTAADFDDGSTQHPDDEPDIRLPISGGSFY
jgi:hypothetical protein